MSKPRNNWWGYVKSMVRLYPGRVEELRRLQGTRTTPGYGSAPGGAESARVTEALATVSLGKRVDREMEAVRMAVEDTKHLPDGADRLELIAMMYWKQTHTLTGACYHCHISDATGRRWHADFIYAVARRFFED